jgi:dUTP pyrophosphatase
MKIKFKKLNKNAVMPKQGYKGDAGFDMTATSVKRIGLFKYQYGTGLAMEIPNGYEGECRPRSSIHKTFMLLSNSPGTIDAGYRGEIMAVFYAIPFISKPYKVGDRIFQLLIKKVSPVEFVETDKLSETDRGKGGYGSTGK